MRMLYWAKCLLLAQKSDPDLTATVKEIKESYTKLSEKQPDTSKTSFNLEWIDSIKGHTEQIRNTDVIITSWQDIANNMLKHFEFSVILSDGNRIILKKYLLLSPDRKREAKIHR